MPLSHLTWRIPATVPTNCALYTESTSGVCYFLCTKGSAGYKYWDPGGNVLLIIGMLKLPLLKFFPISTLRTRLFWTSGVMIQLLIRTKGRAKSLMGQTRMLMGLRSNPSLMGLKHIAARILQCGWKITLEHACATLPLRNLAFAISVSIDQFLFCYAHSSVVSARSGIEATWPRILIGE